MYSFRDYLELRDINNSTIEPEVAVYAAIAESHADITYREASLMFADDPILSSTFERLWYGYESYLDAWNYEREHKEPEHVSIIIDRIMKRLRGEA